MRNGSNHLARGIVAGAAGGLIASWVMNQFIEEAAPKLQKAAERLPEHDGPEQSKRSDAPPEDATMKAADAIVATLTGGRHLTFQGKKVGGPIVHYAFGTIMGGVYGALAERLPSTTSGFGAAFGTVLFTGADLLAVPALNLSSSQGGESAASLATPLAAHVVYGLTTEAVRRLVRALL